MFDVLPMLPRRQRFRKRNVNFGEHNKQRTMAPMVAARTGTVKGARYSTGSVPGKLSHIEEQAL
jgi:hypothetical protein